MSTEELVQALKNFKDNFPISEKDKALITIDEQIKELQSKLDNKESYRTGEVEQSASVNPENEIMRNGFEVRENRVAENTTRLDELGFALEEAEQALVDKRREFSNTDYDNIDMNSPEYQGQQALLTALQDQISEIKNEIAECEDSIARDKSVLEDPKYGKAVFEARMAEDPTLNYRQVFEDERTIEDLQAQYQAEQAIEGYTQAEMTEPIDRWINQIQSGEYDAATISNEMDEFLKNPYLESLTNDRDAEIADIDRQLPEIEMEIDAIKQKQLNVLDYAVSTFEAGSETMGINGTYDRKIERAERSLNLAATARDRKQAELDALYSELVANPNNVRDISRRIKETRDEMATIATAHKTALARLERLRFEKENVLSNDQIERMKQLRAKLAGLNPEKNAREILAITAELESIKENTTLDISSMRMDERRLAELCSTKAALENRKALLSKDMNVELLTIQHYLNPSNTITDSQQPDQQTPDDQTKTNTDTDSSNTGNDNKTDETAKDDDDDLDLDKLMANGIPVKPLTDEERKANLKAALANDTMNNDWLERAENENVYWNQKDKEKEEQKQDAPKKNRLKVAGFAAAGAALKNKAKGMLGKFKEKLASMKENFSKEWKKYVAALIIGGLTILAAIDLSDGKLIDSRGNDTTQEQDADANTPEQEIPEQAVEETAPEEITDEEVANTEDEDDKENENDKDGKTGEQTAEQTQTAPVGPAPIIGDAAAMGPDGIQYDPSGLDLTIPVIPVNPSDQHIISQESHVVSENPEQHLISSTVIGTTGGEELYTKTEEELHEVKVDDQGNVSESTNTSSSSNGSSSSSGNGDVQSVTEEVIEDHVVLPDLGNTETTETIVTEQPSNQPSSEPTPADPTQEAPEIANGQLGTFALGSNETYVAPLSEAYFENANLATDNNAYNVTAQDDGTFTVTNTGDEDIQIAAQQREETNNTIDNSDIAADLAALEAELGVGLSVDTPENNSITR